MKKSTKKELRKKHAKYTERLGGDRVEGLHMLINKITVLLEPELFDGKEIIQFKAL